MRRGLIVGLTVAIAITPRLMAQEEATTVSWAAMFLYTTSIFGLLLIWLLILMSAFSIGFTIKLAIQCRRTMVLPDETRAEVERLIADKKYREAIEFSTNDPSYLGRITSAALGEAANGYIAMERAIEETGDQETTRLLRPIEYLNVLGNISPMIGLFGTVYGMILAFQLLVEKGGNPNPVDLAAGISTALVTTFWGLVVAIPALSAYALIRNKIDALTSEGIVIAEHLIGAFKPGGKKPSGERRPRATPKPEG